MRYKTPSITIFTLFFPLLVLSCGSSEEPTSETKAESNTESKSEQVVVTLSKESLEHVNLKTEPAALGSLGMKLRAAGRVSTNLNKTAKITSTLEGRILKLKMDINDHVKAGDVLGIVQSPELLGKQLELRSPIDGVVMDRQGAPGELVDKTKEIYTISDSSQLWVIGEVKERDIGAVQLGQDAKFSVISYPENKFHGKVTRVGNQVEADSRTLEVRIEVDNTEGLLKAGMFADVEITTTVLDNVLLISDAALQTEDDRQVVFVALDDNRFEKRVVRLGLEQLGRVQVVEGLSVGDKVVTEGSFILKSELLKGELGEE